MNPTVEHWKSQLAILPPEERAELADYLLSSLDDEHEAIEAAWEEEASRRVAEIRSGKVVGRPAEELLDQLRRLYP
jgi:putative addiction module component (TIGR02574 family)